MCMDCWLGYEVKDYMTHIRCLRTSSIVCLYNCFARPADVHEAEILSEMPRHLKGKVVAQLLSAVFRNSELFKALDSGAREMLCSALQPRPLLPGHDLCHPGDKANCLWILQKGNIREMH